MKNNQITRKKILEIGKKEFLDKGFEIASLRQIAKKSGVTTGAIYGYYNDKNALFEDLTKKFSHDFYSLYQKEIKAKLQKTDEVYKKFPILEPGLLIDIFYKNCNILKLLLKCSQGTSQSHYIHSLMELKTKIIYQHLISHKLKINSDFLHMIVSSYFSAIFEIILHDMPRKDAKQYINDVNMFFDSGWQSIIKN